MHINKRVLTCIILLLATLFYVGTSAYANNSQQIKKVEQKRKQNYK